MAHSLVRNYIHLVYATKRRTAWLREDIRKHLFAFQAGILRRKDCAVVAIDGFDEHVHSLFGIPPRFALMDIVRQVKRESSKWMKSSGGVPNFQWQNGYSAFSVSESLKPVVREYIFAQEKHHRRMSYSEELKSLLAFHGFAIDEEPFDD